MITETKRFDSAQGKPDQVMMMPILGKIERAWLDGRRHFWLQGGTWSSKTWSVLQFLRLLLEHYPQPLHITVTSETMPHLKRGCILDFQTIMGADFLVNSWNKTDFIYRHEATGSWIEFTSADVPSKFTGGRRDALFVNEANHVERDTFRQADMRTRLFTICDWNPESRFWFHDDYLDEHDALVDPVSDIYVNTTYLDALPVLPAAQRQLIERFKDIDPNWWAVYGLGMTGKVTGLVHPLFNQVDSLPGPVQFYGLDFGFSVDPTVLTAHVIDGDKLYSHEVFYETAPMTNGDIAMKMSLLGVNRNVPIFADPNAGGEKSAEELRRLGFRMGETMKGPGSVEFGIQKVNQYYQFWTKDSLNCIKEQRNYRFLAKTDAKTGTKSLSNETTHTWSHGMDSRRYSVSSYRRVSGSGGIVIGGW